ncbi:MAG: hypothetical protein HOO91_17750 [Bacteroidales bacterium]|nr:hypothetical protein [Bacteroidales bacterium]
MKTIQFTLNQNQVDILYMMLKGLEITAGDDPDASSLIFQFESQVDASSDLMPRINSIVDKLNTALESIENISSLPEVSEEQINNLFSKLKDDQHDENKLLTFNHISSKSKIFNQN